MTQVGQVLPPELDPRGPGVPVPPRPRRRARLVAGVLSAAVLAASTAGWAASQRYLGELSTLPVFAGLADRPSAGADGATTILVVGSDDRSGLTRAEQARLHTGHLDYGRHTDSIMLVHVGGDTEVTVVSLPRDSLVAIPAYTDARGAAHPEHRDRINAAFSLGGAPLTVQTVERATGLRVDHYVEVDFKGFLAMVDALDGVEVCLTAPVADEDSGLDLPAGRQTVTGTQALAYVRMRKADSDLGRAGRQQKFLAAMLQKASSTGVLLNPLRLNGFVDATLTHLRVDDGLDRDRLVDLAARVGGTGMGQVQFTTVPVADTDARLGGERWLVTWDAPRARALFDALREDRPVAEPAAAAAVPVAPGKVRVRVLNGAGVAGLGRRAADDLAKVGFDVTGVGDADAAGAGGTVVRYDPRWDVSLRTVLAALPGATAQAVAGQGGTFEVVVGSAYAGASPVRVAAATGTPAKPAVRTAADDVCG